MPNRRRKNNSEPWRPHTRRDGKPKVPFDNEADATDDLILRHGHGSPYTVYCCTLCNKWHIGTKQR